MSDEELGRFLESDQVLACNVTRQLVRSDRLDLYAEMWQLRLLRLDQDLHFRGRCDPQFFPPVHETAKGRGLRAAAPAVTLRHYGYVPAVLRSKLERGLRLLELEPHDRPGQFDYLVEYGRTLLALGNEERGWTVVAEAAEQFVPFLDRRTPFNSMVALLPECLLQLPEARLPPGITTNTLFDLKRAVVSEGCASPFGSGRSVSSTMAPLRGGKNPPSAFGDGQGPLLRSIGRLQPSHHRR